MSNTNLDLDDDIFCEREFIGNIFGYKTNIQWVFHTVEWLDECIQFDDNHPLNNPSGFDYRALMRDIAKSLNDNWCNLCNQDAIADALRDSLDNLKFDDKSTLVIMYGFVFDDVNRKLAEGAYNIA